VHTDAIYLMGVRSSTTWTNLDLERKKAYVRKVDVDYYTDAMTVYQTSGCSWNSTTARRLPIVEHGEVAGGAQGRRLSRKSSFTPAKTSATAT
jgi:DEAD/DEAH box helicase domain-containing protein